MTDKNKELCITAIKSVGETTKIDGMIATLPQILIEPWSYNGLVFLIRMINGIKVTVNWQALDDDKKHILTGYSVLFY